MDIPRCPHKYINVDTLAVQNSNSASTLGSGPIGFTTSGVAIYAPFTSGGVRAASDASITLDTCQGYVGSNGRYRTHYGPVCELGDIHDTLDCRARGRRRGFSNAACKPKVQLAWILTCPWSLCGHTGTASVCVGGVWLVSVHKCHILHLTNPLDVRTQGWSKSWEVVGYGVDGFRIFASTTMLRDSQLDNCNGRFTLDPSSGLYCEWTHTHAHAHTTRVHV